MEKINFDKESHTYTTSEGVTLISVTQVLTEAGVISGGNFYTDYACQRGTMSHLACEYYDDGDLDESEIDPVIIPRLEAWKKFKRETKFEVIENELLVHSIHGFAGTLDRLGDMGGATTLVDIKTSAAQAPWWGLQLGGYEIALKEMKPDLGLINRVTVQLLESGEYKITSFKDRNDKKVFLAALALAKWKRRIA